MKFEMVLFGVAFALLGLTSAPGRDDAAATEVTPAADITGLTLNDIHEAVAPSDGELVS